MNTYFELPKEEILEEEVLEEVLEEEFVEKNREARKARRAAANQEKMKKRKIAAKTKNKAGRFVDKGEHCTNRSSKRDWKKVSHRRDRKRAYEEHENFIPMKRGEKYAVHIPKSQYLSLMALRA